MNDSKLLLYVAGVFILLGITLPFYLPSDFGLLPLGMSFLADGIFLLLVGLVAWGCEVIESALREYRLNRWLEERNKRYAEEKFRNIHIKK